MAPITVTLKSSDGRSFKIDLEVVNMLNHQLISAEIENYQDQDSPMVGEGENSDNGNGSVLKDVVVQLHSVTGDLLEKVLEWARHEVQKHKDGNNEIVNRASGMTDWEENYLRNGVTVMHEVAKAAYGLNATGLLDLYFRFVANWIRGRSHMDVPDVLMYQLGRYLKSTVANRQRQ